MLEKYHITNLAAAPTAYRLLLAAGSEAARKIKGQLRAANSAGEPLNPEVISLVRAARRLLHLRSVWPDRAGHGRL